MDMQHTRTLITKTSFKQFTIQTLNFSTEFFENDDTNRMNYYEVIVNTTCDINSVVLTEQNEKV